MIACVTGANGFIGSHVVDRLLAEGYTVRALVRKSSNLRWLEGKNVDFVYGDVRDAASLPAFVANADLIFHIAALVKARTRDEYFEANERATRRLLEAARLHAPGLRRFLYVSSQTAGGPAPSLDAPVTEDSPPNPITTYGESKIAAEKVVKEYTGVLPWTIVRPPAVFGPRDTEIFIYFQTVARGLNSIIGLGEKRLNLIYVEDLVDGFFRAATADIALHQTYFIASKAFYSWPEVGSIVGRALGKKYFTVRIPHAVVYALAAVAQTVASISGRAATLNLEKARDITRQYWICDVSKAERELGFRENTTIDEAIRRTVAWYREQGWLR